ncbi:hypothetical protein ABEH28_13125 [Pseudomonas sp. Ps21-P2]|uniref:hypothetical protein n=1 Tax=Pseudomonas sp. Ps21-P2 TaxID=3080331 RepID=UPI00320B7459
MKKTKEQIYQEKLEEALFFMQLYEEGGIINDWEVPAEKPDPSESGYPEDLRIY